MKIDLSEEIKSLDGEVIAGGSAGHILAEYMMGISSTQPVRLFKIAMTLLDDKPFEIDNDDYKLIAEIVEKSQLPNIMKATILMKIAEG